MTLLAMALASLCTAQVETRDLDCTCVREAAEVPLATLGKCASKSLGVDLLLKSKTPAQRERAQLKLAIEIVDLAEKKNARLVTTSGGIRGADYDNVVDIYRRTALGLDAAPEKSIPGLAIGRKLVDVANPTSTKFSERVPLLVSYRNDREGQESGLTVLGKIDYQWGDGLMVLHTLSADVDSNTKDDPSKSSINLGYAYSRLTPDLPGELFTDAESILGVEWNTDRQFKRKAYTAYYTFIPSSPALGAGYLRGDAWKIAWQPNLSVQAGNVIDAAGNASLEKRAEDGGFVRIAPSFSLVVKPDKLPKLSFGLSYLHTWDVTHGWDRGLLEANATYSLSKGTFITLIHRYGAKKVSFDDIDETLFGIGVTY